MKIVCNNLFPLGLISSIQDSLDYVWSGNGQGENRFHKQKRK